MPNTKRIRKSNRRKSKGGGYRKRINSKRNFSKKRNSKSTQSKKRKGGIRVRKTKRARGGEVAVVSNEDENNPGNTDRKSTMSAIVQNVMEDPQGTLDKAKKGFDTVKGMLPPASTPAQAQAQAAASAPAPASAASAVASALAAVPDPEPSPATAQAAASASAPAVAAPAPSEEEAAPAEEEASQGPNCVDVPPELGAGIVKLIIEKLQDKLKNN
jgi:hypothetical protein